MPAYRPIPTDAVGPIRTLAPSNTMEAMSQGLPVDVPPQPHKPIVSRSKPNPRRRTILDSPDISIAKWDVPIEAINRDLGIT